MESVKTIRAIERAFAVLRALQAHADGATLVELQHDTDLSGPTLLRILKTLIAAKAVRRSTTDQRYRNTVQLRELASAMQPVERLADVAAATLDELCQKVEWPSDLIVHRGDDDFMSVLESSLRQSRFYVRRTRGRVKVTLLGSAAGVAFLSALPVARRAELVEAARRGRDIHNAKVAALGDLEQRVAEARRKGYSVRHPAYRGGSFNAQARDDSLQAIAVPLLAHGQVLGALNINWNRAAMTEREMVKRNLPALKQAARSIALSALAKNLHHELLGTEKADPKDGWPG
ncbi:MAG: helix-turn-helix domain-containing protein [Ottowia sp.]|uniref:helix-turn-helix domain-containing protein n=1 Tax=unclassified Ottowia TaxID=2645081 RepID=UPI003C2F50A8